MKTKTKLVLADLAAKPFELELKHPTTDEGLGVKVQIVGKNSRQFKDNFYAIVGKTQDENDKRSNVEKMKAAEQQSAELIAHCIVGWDDDEFFGGEYSVDKALEIISTPELSWVKTQVDQAIVDETIFFRQ